MDRAYDVVVFGATGFTGSLVGRAVASRAAGLRWAVAGRDRARLEAVREAIGAPEAGVVVADVGDPESLRAMAESTRVIATTVGPYARYGEPVVAACVDAGTHVCDITGEPLYVATIRGRYHDRARDAGVRVVPCCGFDSAPHDLGALYTAGLLPSDGPVELRAYVRATGGVSGGTSASFFDHVAHLRENRRRLRALGRPASPFEARGLKTGLHWQPAVSAWGLPLPTVDPRIVLWSAGELGYGRPFTYGHYLQVRSLARAARLAAGVGALVAAAQLGPTRRLVERWRAPGEGPSEEQLAKGRFSVTFLGRAGDVSVATRVSGGDPGYLETSKMLAETALALARDDLPDRPGVQTTAIALGHVLIDRLTAVGLRFERLPDR